MIITPFKLDTQPSTPYTPSHKNSVRISFLDADYKYFKYLKKYLRISAKPARPDYIGTSGSAS
jgi:hypothetical protein